MDTKKFDVIGIGHPCVDYLAHIDSLPASNESRSVLNGSWQCGGKIPTGLAAAARCGLSCALIGAMGDDLFGQPSNRTLFCNVADNKNCNGIHLGNFH